MLDVKQAVAAAEAYVRDVYPTEALSNLRVEEIERSDDGRVWSITLGWVDLQRPPANVFASVHGTTAPRVYKTLRVDAESGQVQSMKIRAVA